jgi:hypothetical protein
MPDQEEILDLISLERDAEIERQMNEYENSVNQEINYDYVQSQKHQ